MNDFLKKNYANGVYPNFEWTIFLLHSNIVPVGLRPNFLLQFFSLQQDGGAILLHIV
jgi:hypothetical protein